MKTAVLILAHRAPEQLARLCRVLRHPDRTVFVHLDAKADISAFGQAAQHGAVFIRNRTKINWGGWSMVDATLECFREIMETGAAFDYLHLVSGQDYPVKSADEIHGELEACGSRNFLSYRPLDENDPSDRGFVGRYRKYHIDTRSRMVRIAARLANRLLRIDRKPPLSPVYKGGQWLALTHECIEYILGYCAEYPRLVKFFRHTNVPYEMFFQTLLLHSPLRTTIVNKCPSYTRWTEGNPNPETLGTADYDDIIASGAWFARKFDGRTDILDMLDARRDEKSAR